eukprot:scaffold1741_cov262-Pinguiococcus_pyrenoidosus.AAC.40
MDSLGSGGRGGITMLFIGLLARGEERCVGFHKPLSLRLSGFSTHKAPHIPLQTVPVLLEARNKRFGLFVKCGRRPYHGGSTHRCAEAATDCEP